MQTTHHKWGGAALIAATLLMIFRMTPIFSSGAIAVEDFPPDTTASIMGLAVAATGAWKASHLMLFASLFLSFIGFMHIRRELIARGQNTLSLLFITMMSAGLLFYAIAGVADGFLLPNAATQTGLFSELPAESILLSVAYAHEIALTFFGQALTGIFLGIGLLGVALWRAGLYPKWLSGIGAALSALALAGLAAGVFGPYWRSISMAGPIIALSFVWELALGVAMLRHRTASTSVDWHHSDRASTHPS